MAVVAAVTALSAPLRAAATSGSDSSFFTACGSGSPTTSAVKAARVALRTCTRWNVLSASGWRTEAANKFFRAIASLSLVSVRKCLKTGVTLINSAVRSSVNWTETAATCEAHAGYTKAARANQFCRSATDGVVWYRSSSTARGPAITRAAADTPRNVTPIARTSGFQTGLCFKSLTNRCSGRAAAAAPKNFDDAKAAVAAIFPTEHSTSAKHRKWAADSTGPAAGKGRTTDNVSFGVFSTTKKSKVRSSCVLPCRPAPPTPAQLSQTQSCNQGTPLISEDSEYY